jgi:hypothetical protein
VKYKFVSVTYTAIGYWACWPTALNDSGRFCGYGNPYKPVNGIYPSRPFVWDGLTGQLIAPLADDGIAYDINEAGDVVGFTGWWNPDISAFVHQGGTTRALTGLPGPRSCAYAINNSAMIAGVCGGPTAYTARGFVYDASRNAVVEIIEPMPGHSVCYATEINDNGDVAGISYADPAVERRLFYRRNGVTQDMGPVDTIEGMNREGVAVGMQTGDAYRHLPTPWSPRFQRIAPYGSTALAINDAGVVVGRFRTPPRGDAPFVYYPPSHPDAGFHNLNDLALAYDGFMFDATSINKSGCIVGWGEYKGSWATILLEPFDSRPDVLDRYMLRYLKLLGGVEAGGGGWGVPYGGGPVPIPPRGLQEGLSIPRDPAGLLGSLAAIVGDERFSPEVRRMAAELAAAARREMEGR